MKKHMRRVKTNDNNRYVWSWDMGGNHNDIISVMDIPY